MSRSRRSLASTVLALAFGLPAAAQPADDPTGLARRSATSAVATLDRALTAHAPGPPGVVEFGYEGAWRVEGHFRRPHEVRPFPTRERYVTGAGGVRYESITGETESELSGTPETILLLGDRVLRRTDAARPFQEVGEDRAVSRVWATAALPGEVLRRARARATTARVDGSGAVSFTDVDGAVSTLSFDPGSGRLRAVERLRAEPRLGDVCDWVVYDDYAVAGGIAVPGRVRMRRHPLDEAGWLDLRLTRPPHAASGVELEAPGDVLPAPAAGRPASTMPRIDRVAEGVWEVVLEDVDSRVLAVEIPEGLAVLEAPLRSEAGERIVDALAARFPERPIRMVGVGHYHPHYTGGLRAFVAAGATVVTTPGNAAFVKELVARPFTLAPDRLARAPKPLRLELVDGSRRLAGGVIEAIDLGEASQHTDEYLVFHLPAARLLFEGDLGWFTTESGELKAGRRAAGLLSALDARKLAVDTLVQSWPAKGNPGTIGVAELRDLVRKREAAARK